MSALSRRAQVGRAVAAATAVSLILVLLWQAGVIFESESGVGASSDGEAVTLLPADTTIETPGAGPLPVGLRAGELAPDFEFSTFDGRRLKLSDYRGRAVILNFWASWCGPCRAEMPDMEAVLHRFEDEGLAILGVNNGESLRTPTRFLADLDIEFSAFAFDPGQDVVGLYAIRGMPTSYFIDADGLITRVVIGQLTPAILETNVLEALAGPATSPR